MNFSSLRLSSEPDSISTLRTNRTVTANTLNSLPDTGKPASKCQSRQRADTAQAFWSLVVVPRPKRSRKLAFGDCWTPQWKSPRSTHTLFSSTSTFLLLRNLSLKRRGSKSWRSLLREQGGQRKASHRHLTNWFSRTIHFTTERTMNHHHALRHYPLFRIIQRFQSLTRQF